MSLSWGFTIDDKVRLAREWGAACISSLNMGNYTSQYHIYSVQAIYIMHGYEHLVGSTNQWSTLKYVAIAIARGLGLHKLAPHPDDERVLELNAEQKQAFIDREIGRRTWYLMAAQEWLCAGSQFLNTVGIQSRNFTTAPPQHLSEETMNPVSSDTVLTYTRTGTYFFDYASLFLSFQTTMSDLDLSHADDTTRYATVIQFDGEMRAMMSEKTPPSLTLRAAQTPGAPKWVAWAWRHNQASLQHKIITIHQSFLNPSFKDARFMYSRWACAMAAKGIIRMYTGGRREVEEPQWWVEQAFVVTAGICLMLDLFHRAEKSDPEAQEYEACVSKAVGYLQQFVTSSVALHGVRMLVSLQQEYAKMLESLRPTSSQQVLGGNSTLPYIPAPMADIAGTLGVGTGSGAQGLPSDGAVPLMGDEAAQFNFDIDTQNFEDLMDYLPVEGGLDNTVFFDSICGLAGGTSW